MHLGTGRFFHTCFFHPEDAVRTDVSFSRLAAHNIYTTTLAYLREVHLAALHGDHLASDKWLKEHRSVALQNAKPKRDVVSLAPVRAQHILPAPFSTPRTRTRSWPGP